MRRGNDRDRRSRDGRKVLAAAIRREDWERVAALLLLAMTDVVREMPRADIDDVLSLLSSDDDGKEARDDRR
jgi:hypothetical protein